MSVVLILVATAAFFGGRRLLSGKAVDVVTPRRGPMVERVVLTGRVITPGISKLGVSVLGTVASVGVEEGARVNAGQALLSLQDAQQQAAVMQARAGLASAEAEAAKVRRISGRVETANVEEAEVALDQAKRELSRVEQLVQSGAAELRTVETARDTVATASTRLRGAKVRAEGAKGPESRAASARVEQAKAALALAEAGLKETILLAPCNGIVLERDVEVGDIVQPGKVLLVVAQEGPLRLEADADEKNLSLIESGQKAVVVADGYPDKPFTAVLTWISPAVDPERGTVQVRLDPDAPASLLKPDMTVSINLEVSKPRDALLVPLSAVREDATDHPWVQVVREGRARRTPVMLGFRDGKEVEVISGLNEEDLLVDETGVADGATVRAAGEM